MTKNNDQQKLYNKEVLISYCKHWLFQLLGEGANEKRFISGIFASQRNQLMPEVIPKWREPSVCLHKKWKIITLIIQSKF